MPIIVIAIFMYNFNNIIIKIINMFFPVSPYIIFLVSILKNK